MPLDSGDLGNKETDTLVRPPSLGALDTKVQCSVTAVKSFNLLGSVSVLCEDTLALCIINLSEVEELWPRVACL